MVISDSHVPERALGIPRAIEEYITSERFDAVVHAGDVTGRRLLELIEREAGAKVIVVRGNMDYLSFPRHAKVQVEELVLGVVHGDGVYPRGNLAALTRIARALGARVLVSGHTHEPFVVYDKSGVLHVNPGSVTGVWSGSGGSGTPSFAELSVSSRTVAVVVYELADRELVRRVSASYTL